MLLRYFASPGFLGEWMQIYLARDLREGNARPELDEQIEILRMPLSQAMKMIAEGKIHDGKTIIGLSLYDAAARRTAVEADEKVSYGAGRFPRGLKPNSFVALMAGLKPALSKLRVFPWSEKPLSAGRAGWGRAW